MEEVIVEARGVSKNFGSVELFKNVSVKVQGGNPVAVLGPSGIGKTTLLYILASLDKPSSGFVYYRGKLLDYNTDMVANYRSRIGFIFQEPLFIEEMTAEENILLSLAQKMKDLGSIREEMEKLALALGIGNVMKMKVSKLSSGQRKRLEVVRAILKEPEVIIADEPTANLDKESSHLVIETFKRLRESGKGLIFAVHRDEELLSLANVRLNVLDYKS